MARPSTFESLSAIKLRHYPSRTCQFDVANVGTGAIQAPKPEPRIMRHELTNFEWTAIKPFLPTSTRGVPRVSDRRVLIGIFG